MLIVAGAGLRFDPTRGILQSVQSTARDSSSTLKSSRFFARPQLNRKMIDFRPGNRSRSDVQITCPLSLWINRFLIMKNSARRQLNSHEFFMLRSFL